VTFKELSVIEHTICWY